jgi:hypothetical protein
MSVFGAVLRRIDCRLGRTKIGGDPDAGIFYLQVPNGKAWVHGLNRTRSFGATQEWALPQF